MGSLYFGTPTPQELASILEWVNGGDLRVYYLFEKRENLLLLERLEEPKLLLNPITCSIEIDLPFILNFLEEFAHLRLKVCASSLFLKRYADYYTQLETSLYSSHQMNNYRTHELLYRHEEIVENFFQHLFNSESFYKLTPFNQLFSNVPAVICGAGPSLDKEIETLRTLKNRALILSIGSGFTALTGHGICPHLAVAEDGSEGEYESLHLHSGYEVPFFYSTRLNFSVLSLIHGKKRKFSFKEFYPFEKLFSGLFETIPLLEIPKGPASLSSGIQLATFLGCRPIFLVGIDYAYIEERGYSSKVGGYHSYSRRVNYSDS